MLHNFGVVVVEGWEKQVEAVEAVRAATMQTMRGRRRRDFKVGKKRSTQDTILKTP